MKDWYLIQTVVHMSVHLFLQILYRKRSFSWKAVTEIYILYFCNFGMRKKYIYILYILGV